MRSASILLSALLVTACGKSCSRHAGGAASADSGNVVQPKLGGGRDDEPRIEFTIDAVYERQQPTSAPPWHAAGGDWTFFDAQTKQGVDFGFGFQARRGQDSMSFGHAMWTVADREDGATLAREFANVFHGALPLGGGEAPAILPKPFSLALLGEGMARSDDGSFSGTGSWRATKLFLQRPGIEAEVFFNFDLAEKRGEFAEKDSDYADDLLAFIASELRDGPLPPQTPENDARVTLAGPKPGEFHAIGPEGARFLRWEVGPRAWLAVEEAGDTRVVSAALEGDPRETELFRLEHHLGDIDCAPNKDGPCLVEETQPEKPGEYSPDSARAYFLFSRVTGRLTPIAQPWLTDGCTVTSGVSTDGKVLALSAWAPKQKGHPRSRILHFLQTDALGADVSFAQEEDWLNVMGWTGDGAMLRAVVRVGRPYDDDEKASWLAVDPRTGAKTALAQPPVDPRLDSKISPDGKHRVACEGAEQLVITELATGLQRTFPIASRERRSFAEDCDVEWRSPRYLSYAPLREGFVDIESLKLNFPFDPDNELTSLEWEPGFEWVIRRRDKQLEIARISSAP